MKIRLADYVANFLVEHGVTDVFSVVGGGAMHLNDALGHNEGLHVTYNHHEQASAIAAEAYARLDNKIAALCVTTGPGGTNALTGVVGGWLDSIPMFVISGQVRYDTTARFAFKDAGAVVRAMGDQEYDIVKSVEPMTKYAVMIEEPNMIRYALEKAWHLATTGRPGPVWIDIPLDVQAMDIEPDCLCSFNENESIDEKKDVPDDIINEVYNTLVNSHKPVVLIGQGAVASGAYDVIRDFINITHIPVLTTWRVQDFMDSDSKGYYGSPGLQAPRYSNLIIQNADTLLVLGSRLDNMITAFNEEHFAYKAKRIIVDIDSNEINKLNMPGKLGIVCDIKEFVSKLVDFCERNNYANNINQWIDACKLVKKQFPLLDEQQEVDDGVNLYKVTNCVSNYAQSDDVIVISSTSRCNTAGHIAFNHRQGQKTISSMGMGSMGFAIPSAVGAYFASDKRVVVIEGDGSLQLNIQELETIVSNGVDAKMFIFDNRGYAAITTMQDRNFDSFYVGSNEQSKLFMPITSEISKAYGIPCYEIKTDDDIEKVVPEVFDTEGPAMCVIYGSLHFDEIPKCISKVNEATGQRESAALENPYPFLSDEEMDKIQNIFNI